MLKKISWVDWLLLSLAVIVSLAVVGELTVIFLAGFHAISLSSSDSNVIGVVLIASILSAVALIIITVRRFPKIG